MDRRAFLRTLALSLLVAPLAAKAQAGRVYRIGVLSAASSPTPVDQAFLSAMRRLGYVDGQNLRLYDRYAGGTDRLPVLAAELAGLKRGQAELLFIEESPMTNSHFRQLADLATRSRLPAIAAARSFAHAGVLMSYGASADALAERRAAFVDRILKGAKPAHLPLEDPTKFELVINLRTARALGLTIPPSVLARADEVIE